MFVCEDCGAVLHEDELKTEKSYLSDYRGGCYEDITCCPCGGSVTEAEECELCGEAFSEDDLYNGICEGCLHEEMTVENALECGKEESAREEVSINGFLARVFSAEKIDEILTRELERLIDESDDNANYAIDRAEEWCKEDLSYFADWVKGRNEQ